MKVETEFPMPDHKRHGRENYKTKARRYLIEGRVLIHSVLPSGQVKATVRGESGFWNVTCSDTGYWSCPCPAKSRCSHVEAVSLVVSH